MSTRRLQALVGTWDLEHFEVTADDGRPTRYPFGTDARGRVIYAADGHMSAVLSRAGRPPTGPGGLETAHRATDADRCRAYDSYLSYAGRWELDGETILHHVDLALVPDVVGQTLARRAELDDAGGLHLHYTVTDRRGTTHHFSLRWRRAGTDQPGATAP